MQKTVVGFQRSNKTTEQIRSIIFGLKHLKQSKRKEKRRLMLGRSEVELYHEVLLVDPEATISPMVFLAFAPV